MAESLLDLFADLPPEQAAEACARVLVPHLREPEQLLVWLGLLALQHVDDGPALMRVLPPLVRELKRHVPDVVGDAEHLVEIARREALAAFRGDTSTTH